MTPHALEQYLHRHIPLSAAMQVAVHTANADTVVLHAPLAPNINHRETVFGGSASAVATLAAWAVLYVRLATAGHPARVVIQRNTMEYLRPIAGGFSAHAAIAPSDWESFARTFARKGRARIAVTATLRYADQIAGRFAGEFVALAPTGPAANRDPSADDRP